MIEKKLTEEQIDFSISLIFIHLELYFSDEDYPLSDLPRETKLGDILDHALNSNGLTVRELINDIAKDNAVVLPPLKRMPEPSEIFGIVENHKHLKSLMVVDTSSLINFFMPLTIEDVFSFQAPVSRLSLI